MRSCSKRTDWKAFSSTATIRTLRVTNPRVCRAGKTVRLVSNFRHWRNSGLQHSRVGYPFAPENRSPLVPSAYRFSSNHGLTQKSLIGKERGALRAFSLGRSRPVSRIAPKIATALWPYKFCF